MSDVLQEILEQYQAMKEERAALLAALIDLEDAYCDVGPDMTREKRDFGRKALMAARAAIEKATGEPPCAA